jgi:uncharacterized protein (TIRG00374 family)
MAFKGIELSSLFSAFKSIDYIFIIPTVALMIVERFSRSFRWGILYYPNNKIPLMRLFSLLNIGYFYNMVFPARLGDVVRAYLLSDSENIPVAKSLSILFVERLLDLFAVIVLLIALLPFIRVPDWIINSGLVMASGLIIVIILLLLLVSNQERSSNLIYSVIDRIPKINREKWMGQVGKLLSGLDAIKNIRSMINSILLSLGIWILSGASYHVLMRGFNIDQPFSIAILVLCSLGISSVIPSSPGYIGVAHASVVIALTFVGINKEIALSYAIMLHGLSFIMQILLGGFYSLHESISITKFNSQKISMT